MGHTSFTFYGRCAECLHYPVYSVAFAAVVTRS